jgi:(p)ppGpp synthase/HD superfamily hydrolase
MNDSPHQKVIPLRPKPWLFSHRLTEAFREAALLHANQYRKGTEIPYLSHLLGTCAIALDYGATEAEAIAALLHDAIEDCSSAEHARAVVGQFGQEILRIVEACTDADTHPKPPFQERKERYIAHLANVDHAVLLISASDKLHNARAIITDFRSVGASVWARFSAPREKELWYYRALVTAFRENPAHEPALVAELDWAVTEMERL